LEITQYIPKVIEALETASEKIMEFYKNGFEINIKIDKSPVTEADLSSNYIITSYLHQFNIPIISEEEIKPKYEERKNEPLLWLVDPLDGTKEFIQKSGQFCICIALIENGKPILGFIASPTEKKILFGGQSIGAFEVPFGIDNPLDNKWKLEQPEANLPKVLIRSNAPLKELSENFIKKLKEQEGDLDFINKGSALKFFDLLKGNADFYIRLAPTMEWDIAAGQAIFETIGGEIRHIETNEILTYNKKDLRNPHFFASIRKNNL